MRWLAFGCLIAFARWVEASPISVPIYIEDSHAGSFYWLAEHLDLDEECTLIHFDAHSDASALFDSDQLRERLRRVGSLEDRRQLLERWRENGVVQCFNWIEPLMPAPISNVVWVRAPNLTKRNARNLQKEAAEFFDGQLEAAPRASGSFAKRCRVVGLDDLAATIKEGTPFVITIDLDYFAEVEAAALPATFERVWKFVAGCRNLRAVTFAISRPYLKGDEQAHALVRLALAGALSLPTATIQFEPFAKVGNDRSLRAADLRAQKREVPAFSLTTASEELRSLLLANHERVAVRTDVSAWEKILRGWEEEAPRVRLAIKDHEPSTDNIWRVSASEPVDLELQTEPWDAAVERVEWIALPPEQLRCNLTATRADEIGFARGAPPRPRWQEVKLPGRSRTLSLGVAHRATATEEIGALRVKARVTMNGHVRETPAIEVRRFAGAGFRAAISEQFGLPYLFGSGELRSGENSGPETGWGADCANFVVYALRRQGRQIPWCNPKQLKRYLEPVRQNVRAGEAKITTEDIAKGLIVHFGSHVAAVMEDRPPLGTLDAGDIVAHQLEGAPEMLSLGQLLKSRKTTRFDLFRMPQRRGETDLIVGGDVMLGRTVGERIEAGVDPFGGLREYFRTASCRLVNLECVLSSKGQAITAKRYSLRAPDSAIRVLTSAQIEGVSLANNHTTDFGNEALADSLARLEASGIAAMGAGETPEQAYAPRIFTTGDGRKIAVIALTDLENDPSDGTMAVATASERDRVSRAIAEAHASAQYVLCLPHWGDENAPRVHERQRELARWLIDHGVDAVAGSHPHCLQPLDFYHGRPIVYSLGNLVFDGAPELASWNRGALLEVNVGGGGESWVRLVPVRLDARGFPRIAEADDDQPRGKIPAAAGAAFSRNRVQGASKKR